MDYDIFNGDADGIIALLQLRFACPRAAQLVTGVKRDIQLVEKVKAGAGDSLTILDISMEKNITALSQALAQGAQVFYADHHKAGVIPQHSNLQAHIDLDANTCTALIIDQLLDRQYHLWAITAAYGDNLIATADELADQAGLSAEQKMQLKQLGTLINYNGYGTTVADLHYHPADLYHALRHYLSPLEVIADPASPFYTLQAAYQADLESALSVPVTYASDKLQLFVLPNDAASRRISGVYGNWLANQNPDAAHAVLTENPDGRYTVSLRAPLNNKHGAAAVCSQFPTGGGREAAAGVNALKKEDISGFIDAVEIYYA
ncbi:DHH family phosphoesterase [Vibrio sp. CAU 1672]|uniref:DHH family phosphoesterase n=1 Tax=Vibrio sp. CAU 1672 TaxID=3032594 RepID=UPI0023DCCFD3|nr:DHH family phosphoesterase [Vibrio sp. CAU 1672]MDF2154737.1 DHH family phosphoesterase [Vibrio sp. CAU 1672]